MTAPLRRWTDSCVGTAVAERSAIHVEGPAPEIQTFRFSTGDLPERDRVPMMREEFGRLIVRVDFELPQDAPFHFQTVVRALPGLAISTFSTSLCTVRRTRELLADGNDDVSLAIPAAGASMVSQSSREAVIGAGDAMAISTADLCVAKSVAVPHSGVTLVLRRRVLATLVPDIEDRFLRPIRGGNGALHLLTRYIGLFDEPQALTTPELRRLAVDHVYDLAALALGATLSRFLLDQRLARAHRMLGNPRLAERTISAIAYEAGFGDVSNFNRAFRERYGETPSHVRSSARKRDS